MVEGAGPGPEADAAIDADSVDANHIASVETPIGRFDIYTYTSVEEEPMACTQISSPGFGSGACGEEPLVLSAEEVNSFGVGVVGDWLMLEIAAGEAVASVVVTTEDSTMYRSNVLAGHALVVYPAGRGAATIQGQNSAGAPIGDPITVTVDG